MKVKLLEGDAIVKLKKIPNNFVDAIVTDPPAGISFMGKDWDHDKGGRDNWIKWMTDIFVEAKRTLKPGGHCFVWALPRTSHWTATALEDAGFEIRDIITHVFGSGFPKSHNISKAIDAKLNTGKSNPSSINKNELQKKGGEIVEVLQPNNGILGEKVLVTKKIGNVEIDNDEAKQWDGWGSALKPASEHWILCRKPLSEKTIADNVLKWGVGGLNIDISRIEIIGEDDRSAGKRTCNIFDEVKVSGGIDSPEYIPDPQGRFPANFIHDGSDEVMEEFDKAGILKSSKRKSSNNKEYEGGNINIVPNKQTDYREDNTYGDEGSAARFFYCSKASGKEKNEGLDELPLVEIKGRDPGQDERNTPYKVRPSIGATYAGQQTTSKIGGNPNKPTKQTKNAHPTVKPVKLMTYLINMITPKDGIVLDPFMGSGSTGVAAVKAGFNFIGIEMEPEYMKIAKARIDYANNNKRN